MAELLNLWQNNKHAHFLAASRGHASIVRKLLDAGADIAAKSVVWYQVEIELQFLSLLVLARTDGTACGLHKLVSRNNWYFVPVLMSWLACLTRALFTLRVVGNAFQQLNSCGNWEQLIPASAQWAEKCYGWYVVEINGLKFSDEK